MEDQIRYHESRAAQELSISLAARSALAARAHLQLCSLHRERVQALRNGSLAATAPQQLVA